ncbi:hypothetical protein JHK82_040656 [Glycine max]|nr:hypothetical protein JHK82_040656 [Glycine max]
MGKQVVPVKSVIYALSPFQQKIMPGLWKDLPTKIHHKVSENWISATLLLGPLVGTYAYVQNYLEKEKLAHRVEVKPSNFISILQPRLQDTLQCQHAQHAACSIQHACSLVLLSIGQMARFSTLNKFLNN